MTYKATVKKYYKDSGIAFTQEELDSIEYADFGLGNIETEGLNLIINR